MRDPRPLRVVVGGGIAGLAAAHLLADDPSHDVLVLEGSATTGGKLRTEPVAGIPADVGAEAMLNRRPEGVDLARELGLGIVHPATTASQIWTRGALRPLPRSLMGVPLDLAALAASGILSAEGLARAGQEPEVPPSVVDGDVSVGDLVAQRCGEEVVDRLVEPLLGGVYAGYARELSALASVPQLVEHARRGSILEQAGAIAPTYDAPVFAGVAGGMGGLADALAGSGRFAVRTGAPVRELRLLPDPGSGAGAVPPRFALTVGSAAAPELVLARDVVLAVPPAPTARLLADLAPSAAAELAAVETASMAVVTLAFRAREVPELPGSGFLVPPVDGRRIKAATFSFAKWDWVREAGRGLVGADDVLLLRASLGRHREAAALQRPDDELVAAALADLAEACGLRAVPVDTHVQRWGGGLPQYAVGHLDRVARIRAGVAGVPGLAVCGATYDGIGIPAVLGSARRAVAGLCGAQWPA